MALKDLVGKVGTRPEPAETTTAPPAKPARAPEPQRPERASAPVALLDASVEFKGTIVCRESIRIDGRCEGELHSDHAVIIGQPARLRMSIEADSVVVAGEVDGDITARRKITLEPTARVHGNLCTPGIVIQEGAKLEGRIVIDADQGPDAEAPAPRAESRDARPEPSAKPERPAAGTESKGEAKSSRESERPRKPTSNAPPPSS